MRKLNSEEIKRLKNVHDRIKNHEFRKNPQRWLLGEYSQLFTDALDIIGRWICEDYDDENKCWKYLFYKGVKDRWLHYRSKWSADGYFHYNDTAEIFVDPGIGLYDYTSHDFNAVRWMLNNFWEEREMFKDLIGRFTEMAEIRLMILHRLIEGQEIKEIRFPVKTVGSSYYNTIKLVWNQMYDGWTLEEYLHKEWYEDRGYVD